MTNASDQWLLEGDCKKCRRAKYFSKPCTKNMNASRAMVRLLANEIMLNATVGERM